MSNSARIVPEFRGSDFQLKPGLKVWLRRIIILVVLAFSLVLPFLPSQRLALLIPALVFGGAAASVFLRWPPFGVVLIVFGTMLIPTPGVSDPRAASYNITMVLVFALVGLWLFDMFTRQRQLRLVSSRTNLPLLLFVLIAGLSFINSQLNYYALAQVAPLTARLGGLALMLLSVGVYFLVANQIHTRLWLRRLTWLFVAICAFYVFARITPQTQDYIWPLFQYGSDASLFWLWMACIIFSQALLNKRLNSRWRLALGIIFLGAAYISISQAYTWKSGWIPAVVGLIVILWMSFPRWRLPLILVTLIGVLFNFALFTSTITGGEDYSILTRTEAWGIVLEITKVNPILGLGPANYYWYTPLFPLLGYVSQFSSHNNYIDIFAQTGLVGLFFFLWFFWESGWIGLRLKDQVEEGFDKAYVIGALGGLAGTLVAGMLGDWVIPFIYNVGVHGFRSSVFTWIFLAGLVVLEHVYRNKKVQEKQVSAQ